MKQLQLRYARPDEGEQILGWLKGNPQNFFNPRILKYPTLRMLCSYDESGPVAYVPVHTVLMMESVALNPEASEMNVAQALRDLVKGSQLIADAGGMREIYFLGGHGGVGEMAASPKGHSFTEVNLAGQQAKVYRNLL